MFRPPSEQLHEATRPSESKTEIEAAVTDMTPTPVAVPMEISSFDTSTVQATSYQELAPSMDVDQPMTLTPYEGMSVGKPCWS